MERNVTPLIKLKVSSVQATCGARRFGTSLVALIPTG